MFTGLKYAVPRPQGLWHVYELIYPLFWSWHMHDHMHSNARYTRSPPLSRRIFSSLLVDFLFISASHDPTDGLKILWELCIFVLLRMSSRIFHAWSTFIWKSIWCFTSRGSYLLLPQASSRVKPWELKKKHAFLPSRGLWDVYKLISPRIFFSPYSFWAGYISSVCLTS